MIRRKSGRRKRQRLPLSIEPLTGKALCILLVVILTVGAFLAPKMINSIYDSRTLMQTRYVDMHLNTYEVAYNNFQEKLERIANVCAYGEELSVLPVEETAQAVSDKDLTAIVNQEIGKLAEEKAFLCESGWWGSLTEENLVRREKKTAYVRSHADARGETLWKEMPPLQFWVLEFMMTEEQIKDAEKYDAARQEYIDKMIDAGQTVSAEMPTRAVSSIRVVLDAEFYKVYALSLDGAGDVILSEYGLFLGELAGIWREYEVLPEYRREVVYLMLDAWSAYWGVNYLDRGLIASDYSDGNMIGRLCFPNDTVLAEENDKEGEIAEGAGEMESVSISDEANSQTRGKEVKTDKGGIVDMMYADVTAEDADGGATIDLEAGCRVEVYETTDLNWTQEYGCREFFEMLQF